MLKSANKLAGLIVSGTDGDVGAVKHLLFEHGLWVVRYMVVDLEGAWVLVSPISVDRLAAEDGRILVRATREKVLGSPGIDGLTPVSRSVEYRFNRYYGFPGYWLGSGLWGEDSHPASLHGILEEGETGMNRSDERDESCYVTSSTDVVGFRVEAQDGSFGHVDDLLVDEIRWSIPYIIISVGTALGTRRILIDSRHVYRIAAPDEQVIVGLPQAAIRAGREL